VLPKTRSERGQVSFEYLLLVAAALIIVVLVLIVLQSNLFKPTETDITNKSGAIKSLIANASNLSVPGGSGAGAGTGTPPGFRI
jgi:uncharacterized protein (UPF0333 family)